MLSLPTKVVKTPSRKAGSFNCPSSGSPLRQTPDHPELIPTPVPNPLILSLSKDRLTVERNRLSCPATGLAQDLGELLPDFGNLGPDYYLAIHTAGIVLVKQLMLRFRLIEFLEWSQLGYHRPIQFA